MVAAIRADPRLTARQRQALLQVYAAFVDRAADGRGAEAPRPSYREGLDEAVLFQLGSGSSFVTGSLLSVDGGMAVR